MRKKWLQKTADIPEMRPLIFENCQKWPLSKGYSLCIMVSLAQKLKMPNMPKTTLQAHYSWSMQKKWLQKTADFPEMRPF